MNRYNTHRIPLPFQHCSSLFDQSMEPGRVENGDKKDPAATMAISRDITNVQRSMTNSYENSTLTSLSYFYFVFFWTLYSLLS